MKTRNSIHRVAKRTLIAALLLAASSTFASTFYSGKIDLVAVTQSPGYAPQTRFYITALGLSLFGTEPFAIVMREAFFNKSMINANYDVIACPNGLTGVCGNLVYIAIAKEYIP